MIQRCVVDIFQASPGELRSATPLAGAYRFRRLDMTDFVKSTLGQEKGRAARFGERLQQGHQAWGYVASNDTLACYFWLSAPHLSKTPPNFESGLLAGVPPGAIYIWDCRSHPDFERQGLYRNGLHEHASRAAEFGAKTALIATRRENARSRNSILAVGFQQTSSLTCYRFRSAVLVVGNGTLALTSIGSTFALAIKTYMP